MNRLKLESATPTANRSVIIESRLTDYVINRYYIRNGTWNKDQTTYAASFELAIRHAVEWLEEGDE